MSTDPKKATIDDYDQLYPGRFLKWRLFGGKDVTLTISDVMLETMPGKKGPEEKAILAFRQTTKQLVLCRTNGECVKGMFGRKPREWIGKRVTFFPDPTVKVGQEVKGGIRVKGSPDLALPTDVVIELPRKAPFTMTMHVTRRGAETTDAPPADTNPQPGA